MQTLLIIQARFSSRRLPGKVLAPIMDKPLLQHIIERLAPTDGVDRCVVATSSGPKDDVIDKLCRRLGVDCFRGSLADVLDRIYRCAAAYRPRDVIRITGDCVLLPSHIVSEQLSFHRDGGYDYSSNGLEPTLPDGLDCEVVSLSTLETAWREAELRSEREHVTQFIYTYPERFNIGSLRYPTDRSKLRWTVDEPEDLEVVRAVFEELSSSNLDFTYSELVELFERRPDLSARNEMHEPYEGYAPSPERDRENDDAEDRM